MRIAMMNCASTCTIYDLQSVGPIYGTLEYSDIQRNRRRLCQNIGGSGGYFQCYYDD